MKIGLISYHNEPNYGTMLQAFALSKALNMLGIDNEYLCYRGIHSRSFAYSIIRNLIRKIIPAAPSQFDFFYTDDFSSTLDAFNNFHQKYIPTSVEVYNMDTIKDANKRYDKFIVGSDQTWSEYMNRSGDTANFLSFVSDNAKKNSYAPSLGSPIISNEYASTLKHNLSSFNHLSCREKENCEKLTEILGKKVEYVLDPTFLLTKNNWDDIAIAPNLHRNGYILAYILGEKECIAEYAESLGTKINLPVYYILTRPKYLAKNNCVKGVGPAEFIGLIREAAYVVTDSFHGTAFCLNYGKQVYSFTKRDVKSYKTPYVHDNDRIKMLLSEFGLENRAKEDNDFTFEADYDPWEVLKHLESLRASSWAYLKSIQIDESNLY